LFKAKMGCSIHNYWIDMRMKKAAQMIKSERSNLENIAYDLGYKDVSFFSKQFKKVYGINAKDFRRSLY
jgi:YesN/AraC family two-component response regulator